MLGQLTFSEIIFLLIPLVCIIGIIYVIVLSVRYIKNISERLAETEKKVEELINIIHNE